MNHQTVFWKRIAYTLPALAVAGLLFHLSSLSHIDLPLDEFSGNDKIIHAAAYCFLGITLLFAAHPTRRLHEEPLKAYVILLAIGMLYGLSDEIHQSFVVNRTCTLGDFIADSVGVAVALWGRHLLWRRHKGPSKGILARWRAPGRHGGLPLQ